MSYSYEELKKKTVAQLREIASSTDHAEVKGYTQLNKEHLIKALCSALKINTHSHHEVVGVDKKVLKNRIKDLKEKRDKAISEKNYKVLKITRRKIHKLKRKIHKATV
ncbi:MAG: hypothetical protein PVI26_10265 [Chitinispirillia bacterium]|jgi:hypothetical protein